jgi:hypothetical protein
LNFLSILYISLWALRKVRKGHKKVNPEGQMPLVAAEKKWERNKRKAI